MEQIREEFLTSWLPDGRLHITAARPGSYKIYWSAAPDGFTDDNELPGFEHETVVDNPLAPRRCYYHIFSKDSYSVAAPRILIPDMHANLRDLGGYNTKDASAFVRHGALYRSHALSEFDADGRKMLETLGIQTIVDLRTPHEANHRPDPVLPGAEYYNLPPMTIEGINQFAVTLNDIKQMGAGGPDDADKDLKASYRTMAFDNEAYWQFFRLILEGKTPMLFHCAAGKDRTGIAAALILWALDVPRDTIYYDYMLTNLARQEHIRRVTAEMTAGAGDNARMAEAIRYFVGVDISSLQSTFEEIDSRYGDKAAFFQKELLVSPGDIARLKESLLIKHKMA